MSASTAGCSRQAVIHEPGEPLSAALAAIGVREGGEGRVGDHLLERLPVVYRRADAVIRRKQQHGPFERRARPPELADLAFLAGKATGGNKLTIVYPDPPIGTEEADLMNVLRGNIELRTLSELELLP